MVDSTTDNGEMEDLVDNVLGDNDNNDDNDGGGSKDGNDSGSGSGNADNSKDDTGDNKCFPIFVEGVV